MKALQDNAEWISQVYEQETGEGNWKVADVSFKQSRFPAIISAATTTSLTTPNTSTPFADGDSVTLSNSTDGDVEYTVSVASTLERDHTGQQIENSTNVVGNFRNHILSSGYYYTGRNVVFNKTGDRFFTYIGSGTYHEYSTSVLWDPTNNYANATLKNSFSITTSFPVSSNYSNFSFSNDGTKAFFFGAHTRYVDTFDMSTPFDLKTATLNNTFDFSTSGGGTPYYDFMEADVPNDIDVGEFNTGGFCQLRFNDDGTKGIFVRRDDQSNGASSMDHNFFWSFALATPYDFSSVTNARYDQLTATRSTAQNILCAHISRDGKQVYYFDSQSGSVAYVKMNNLNVAFDVRAGNTYIGAAYIGSYDNSNSYAKASGMYVAPNNTAWGLEVGTSFIFTDDVTSGGATAVVSQTTLDTTSASLTVAPTSAIRDSSAPAVSIQAQTKADFEKEKQHLAINSNSTTSSLILTPPPSLDGSVALATGDKLDIDNTTVTVGTVTRTANYWDTIRSGSVGSLTTQPSKDALLEKLYQEATVFGGGMRLTQTVTLEGTSGGVLASGYEPRGGCVFSHDGKYFFVNAPTSSYTYAAGFTTTSYRWIVRHTLSTPWDLSTATATEAYNTEQTSFYGIVGSSVPTINYSCCDFQFNEDGTKFYILNRYSTGYKSYLSEYALSTPYDLASRSHAFTVDLNTAHGNTDVRSMYAFRFTRDGKFCFMSYSESNWTLTSSSLCSLYVIPLSTPFDLSTMTAGYVRASQEAFCVTPIGVQETGYYSLTGREAQDNSNEFRYFFTTSGNLQSYTLTGTAYSFTTYVKDYTDSNYWLSTYRMAANDTMYIEYRPQIREVRVITGPFVTSLDRYTVDVSGASLSSFPKSVDFSRNTTYDSLGSATLQSSTSSERTYAYSSKSLDAEALRFKIEGDTDAEIKQVNVDLFTS